MKSYTLGADAEDIVITSNTEGLSLIGGYYESLGTPYSYLLGTIVGNNPNDVALVTGELEANKEYILLMKADVNAGYDVSGLTEANVTLNGTLAAYDCEEIKAESCISLMFVLPVLTENDNPYAKYTITVNDSYASVTGAGEYEAGDIVALAVGSRSGYTFSGWTSDDITIPNAGNADTGFVMPAQNVTVTANWTYNGGSSSSGSGSSSGGFMVLPATAAPAATPAAAPPVAPQEAPPLPSILPLWSSPRKAAAWIPRPIKTM